MFFKDTNDFKNYFGINVSFDFSELTVWLKKVDTAVLKKYLGANFLDQLQISFDAAASAAAVASPEKEIIELIRQCTAPLTVAEWIPSGQVLIDSSGIRIASTENMKTAFQWQIRDLQDSLNQSGTVALDDLLEYLHVNMQNLIYPCNAYYTSIEYMENKYLFVPSAKEFTRYFSPMNNSSVSFFKLKSIIRKVEDFQIKAVLLPDYFADLKTKIQSIGNLSPDDQIIIDMIKPALVNLTISKSVNELAASITKDGYMVYDNTGGRETTESKKQAAHVDLSRIATACEIDGKEYLAQLQKFLQDNTATYAMYASDPKFIASSDDSFFNQESNNFYAGL